MDNPTKKSNISSYIKTGLFFLVAGILIIYIVIGLFLPDQSVKVFGFKPYVIVTNSMEPVLKVNDLVVVKKADTENLKVDDIITFRADINYDGEKEVVTHYVYSVAGTGDNLIIRTHPYYENSVDVIPDFWVLNGDDILGEYMFNIPKLGYVVEFVKSPFGIGAMVVNIGVIAGIVYLIKNGKDKKEI